MNDLTQLINLIPERYRMYVLLGIALSPYVTRAIHALINDGGLRGVFAAIFLGTNVPKPIAPETALTIPSFSKSEIAAIQGVGNSSSSPLFPYDKEWPLGQPLAPTEPTPPTEPPKNL